MELSQQEHMKKRIRNSKINIDKSRFKRCAICRKLFYKKTFQSYKEWEQSKYCSRKCYWKTVSEAIKKRGGYPNQRKGTSKGWLHKQTGYIVMVHPETGKKILQHRYIVERAIGRPLKKHEVVHHKNGAKTDNRIDNLSLLTDYEHRRMHYLRKDMAYIKGLKIKICEKCNVRYYKKHICNMA